MNKGAKVKVIKKYKNRKLYNIETSSYVTLGDLELLVRQGEAFLVYDCNYKDITLKILLSVLGAKDRLVTENEIKALILREAA